MSAYTRSTRPRAWQMVTAPRVFGEKPPYEATGRGRRDRRRREQSIPPTTQPSRRWHLWEESWRQRTERWLDHVTSKVLSYPQVSGVMVQVQSHTRDSLENHLMLHPLNDQPSFLPPPALSNPSPLPHSLNSSDLEPLHRHRNLHAGDL